MGRDKGYDDVRDRAILEDIEEYCYENRIMSVDDEIEERYKQYNPEDAGDYIDYERSSFFKKISAKHMDHKEIAYRIKKFSKDNFNGWIIILVILSICDLINMFYLFSEGYDVGYVLLVSILSIIGIVILYFGCYFVYLITTGYAAIIEDLNHIKSLSIKDDDENNFDDLPRF